MPIFWHPEMVLQKKIQPPSPSGFGVISDRSFKNKFALGYYFITPLKLCRLPVPSVFTLALSSLYFWKQNIMRRRRYFPCVSTSLRFGVMDA